MNPLKSTPLNGRRFCCYDDQCTNDECVAKTMGESKKPDKLPVKKSTGVLILFVVLIAWTLFIAFGSFQTQASTDYRRPMIVIACMGVFLGGWAMALRMRNKR